MVGIFPCVRWWYRVGVLLGCVCWWSPTIGAQSIAPPPGSHGFRLHVEDDTQVKFGKYQHVLVRDGNGDPQVGQLLCRADDQFVIIRPTGELDIVPRDEIRPTKKAISRVSKSDVVASLQAVGLRDYKIAAAKPYVFAYGCNEAFYLQTRSILLSMYPGVMDQLKEWGLATTAAVNPLLVVITPNRSEFDKLSKMPPDVAAYYSVVTNQIVLYEDPQFADAAPELALKQAAYTIVHEGVHQLLANARIQNRLSDWPMWISEGLPEYLCPLAVNSRLVTIDGAQLPERTLQWTRPGRLNDLRMHSLMKRESDGGELIRKAVMAGELDADGYAVSWALVHYLAKMKQEQFTAYLQEISGLKPLHRLEDEPDRQSKLFVKYFGDDFRQLESDVQRYLNGRRIQKQYRDPIENMTRYLVIRVVKKGRVFENSMAVTLSPAKAREIKDSWRAENRHASIRTVVCKGAEDLAYQRRKFAGG